MGATLMDAMACFLIIPQVDNELLMVECEFKDSGFLMEGGFTAKKNHICPEKLPERCKLEEAYVMKVNIDRDVDKNWQSSISIMTPHFRQI